MILVLLCTSALLAQEFHVTVDAMRFYGGGKSHPRRFGLNFGDGFGEAEEDVTRNIRDTNPASGKHLNRAYYPYDVFSEDTRRYSAHINSIPVHQRRPSYNPEMSPDRIQPEAQLSPIYHPDRQPSLFSYHHPSHPNNYPPHHSAIYPFNNLNNYPPRRLDDNPYYHPDNNPDIHPSQYPSRDKYYNYPPETVRYPERPEIMYPEPESLYPEIAQGVEIPAGYVEQYTPGSVKPSEEFHPVQKEIYRDEYGYVPQEELNYYTKKNEHLLPYEYDVSFDPVLGYIRDSDPGKGKDITHLFAQNDSTKNKPPLSGSSKIQKTQRNTIESKKPQNITNKAEHRKENNTLMVSQADAGKDNNTNKPPKQSFEDDLISNYSKFHVAKKGNTQKLSIVEKSDGIKENNYNKTSNEVGSEEIVDIEPKSSNRDSESKSDESRDREISVEVDNRYDSEEPSENLSDKKEKVISKLLKSAAADNRMTALRSKTLRTQVTGDEEETEQDYYSSTSTVGGRKAGVLPKHAPNLRQFTVEDLGGTADARRDIPLQHESSRRQAFVKSGDLKIDNKHKSRKQNSNPEPSFEKIVVSSGDSKPTYRKQKATRDESVIHYTVPTTSPPTIVPETPQDSEKHNMEEYQNIPFTPVGNDMNSPFIYGTMVPNEPVEIHEPVSQYNNNEYQPGLQNIRNDHQPGIQNYMNEYLFRTQDNRNTYLPGIQDNWNAHPPEIQHNRNVYSPELQYFNNAYQPGIQEVKDEYQYEVQESKKLYAPATKNIKQENHSGLEESKNEYQTGINNSKKKNRPGVQYSKDEYQPGIQDIMKDILPGIQDNKNENVSEIQQSKKEPQIGIQYNKTENQPGNKEINPDNEPGIQNSKNEDPSGIQESKNESQPRVQGIKGGESQSVAQDTKRGYESDERNNKTNSTDIQFTTDTMNITETNNNDKAPLDYEDYVRANGSNPSLRFLRDQENVRPLSYVYVVPYKYWRNPLEKLPWRYWHHPVRHSLGRHNFNRVKHHPAEDHYHWQ